MLELHVKFLATLYTSLLMTALVGLLVFSGFKLQTPKLKGKVISAQMIDISQIKRMNQPKSEPKTTPPKPQPVEKQPIKEPPVIEPPKPEPIKETAQPIKKVEPPKPEPIKPDVKKIPIKKADTKKQDEAKKRQEERRKKLEEIRQKRIEAQQRAEKEAQYLESLNKNNNQESPIDTPVIGSSKGDTNVDETTKILGLYQAAVISSVTRAWNKPPVANKDLICHVNVRQIIGGGVIDASIGSPCNASAIVKKSILDAIKKASPLPYKGFEKVFNRSATFIFNPKE